MRVLITAWLPLLYGITRVNGLREMPGRNRDVGKTKELKCGPNERVLALEGAEASLPCQVRFDGTEAQYMEWTVKLGPLKKAKKNKSKLTGKAGSSLELMYRLDGGNGTIDTAGVWKDHRWSHKARFSLLNSELQLINLNVSDSGVYGCNVRRVDGSWKNCSTQLFVQAPLPAPRMEINHEIISLNETTIGPYTEREMLNASCSLSHSYHYPIWYNWTLDGDQLPLVPTNTSILHLGPLNRTYFMKNLCCVVFSASSLRPTSICAQLLVNLGAESVSIRAWHSPLVLGIPQEIECEVHGGFPPPEITWRLNDEPYSNVIFYDSTQLWAVSVIVLTPEEKHMGVRLECRAENRNAGEYKSQFIRLDIKYKPDVTLKIGRGLNATGINAGSDVYLECSVQEILLEQGGQAMNNHVITWKHNGKVLKSNRTAGILITDKYLVLRNLQKRHRGHYTCQVMNTALQDGEDITSSPLFLVIHYAPRCTTNAIQKAFVDKGSKAILLCPVDMQPWNRFSRVYWSILTEDNFTRSNHLEVDITEHMLEEGEVTCWGENKLGSGRQSPCRLQLLEKDNSSNDLHSSSMHQEMIRTMECTVHNVTMRAILVACENFNNNFVNYTVVAELFRDRQVVSSAQLSFSRIIVRWNTQCKNSSPSNRPLPQKLRY
ncbi:uncharacterized protein LOC111262416 isoform X2 [Varroa jacobsoni]|uniref:uncharacterized protein LOC111262416 isoform X2 n=1 Tax=Varroa jacobsoni TaxID=62625 RepID=UPI000BFA528A|nr:uncharacterized protein LOC111262416 isoform X2 [Varroa jacobsoni]